MNPENGSKTEQVKQALLRDIRENRYAPGDVLPSVLALGRRFNVSKHTISQALSNLNELNIIEVAHGKKTRVTQTVGGKLVKIYFFGNGAPHQEPFWDEFYRGIVEEFHQHPNFKLELAMQGTDFDNLAAGLANNSLSSVGGALLLGDASARLSRLLQQKNIPAINVFDYIEEFSSNFITTDFEQPIREMLSHFAIHGCKRVAIFNQFSKEETHGINNSKRQIFLRIAQEMGLLAMDLPGKLNCNPLETSYCLIKRLAEEQQLPDAIFLASDNMAQGVFRAAYELGIKIPQDICICGCNNLPSGKYLIPQLSSIDLSRYEQGRLAAAGLLTQLHDRQTPGMRIKIPAKLLIRESC